MLKRVFDFVASGVGLVLASPVLLPVMFLVWRQDGHSPFYVAERVGQNDRLFKMVKLRSMVINADKSGVDSTGANDNRITAVGRFIRRIKFDEFPQLWNVLKGEMSLVGPRPNVQRETDLYTSEEKRLLSVRPGITDISSIVFADEGSILEGRPDPDLAYNQLIRPYKSRLGLLYVEHAGVFLDVHLILLTLLSAVNRRAALNQVGGIVAKLGASRELITVALRQEPLQPAPPPGATEIVASRGI